MKHLLITAVVGILIMATNASADKLRKHVDEKTGVTINYVTNSESMNTAGYPTCRTWSKDGKFIFVESDRPRPDGTVLLGERQLLKVNAETGETIHLASLEAEDTAKYGAAHISGMSTQYHFDYAPEGNVLVYYDMTGHNMYLMNPDTGERKLILHEPEGRIGDPPAITLDGKRIVYYVFFPAPANRFFMSHYSVIFALDVDPKTLEVVSGPKVVTTYVSKWMGKDPNGNKGEMIICHSQVNPIDPDHYVYAHQYVFVHPNGSADTTRVWENKDGIDRPLSPSGVGRWQTHEVIGESGQTVYYVERWGVGAVDFESRKDQTIYPSDYNLRPCHITVSPDEKWIAADMWFEMEKHDENRCFDSGIMLIEKATGKAKVVCYIKRGHAHPRHPHPNFCPDGKKIAFTVAEGKRSSVAWVDVSEMMSNWDND